jgi:hypothetical protein
MRLFSAFRPSHLLSSDALPHTILAAGLQSVNDVQLLYYVPILCTELSDIFTISVSIYKKNPY